MPNLDKKANVTTYEIRVTDPFGTMVDAVDNFVSLYYARKVNNIGELALVIEYSGGVNFFLPENRIEVWRHKEGSSKLDMNAVWFIHTVITRQQLSGAVILEVQAHDQIGLLERRVIPYNEGNPTTEKQAEGDNVIKSIMRENFGSLATDTERDLSTYLTIQENTTLGPQVTIFCAKDNVLDTIREIADTCYDLGTFIAYDLIYNPNAGTFEFRAYVNQRGIDRSAEQEESSLIVGLEYGSLASISMVDSRREEMNYIYAGAKDLVGIVPPQTATNDASIELSPFHRKELFLNASNADDSFELQDEANRALEENKYRAVFEAELSQEFALIEYGDRFDYGDRISVSFMGRNYTAFVDAISVNVNTSGETINVNLVEDVSGTQISPTIYAISSTPNDVVLTIT
jgi:hypothetical protein